MMYGTARVNPELPSIERLDDGLQSLVPSHHNDSEGTEVWAKSQ